jgi:hypothetical protein
LLSVVWSACQPASSISLVGGRFQIKNNLNESIREEGRTLRNISQKTNLSWAHSCTSLRTAWSQNKTLSQKKKKKRMMFILLVRGPHFENCFFMAKVQQPQLNLVLGARDIFVVGTALCVVGCSGFCSLPASSNPHPCCGNLKYLQTLPSVLGVKIPPD